jgi:orotate phosphoribosyltransferase
MEYMKEKIEKLKNIIQAEGIIFSNQQKIIGPSGNEESWIFDLRNVFLKPEALELIADVFWKIFKDKYPFQVGGQEISAIPLISAIILKSQQEKMPISGFIIRKSRKPHGLQKIIEGQVTDEKIILVDDLINGGRALDKQAKILADIGKKADALFTLINFRGMENIDRLKKNHMELTSLFTLDDFDLLLERSNIKIFKRPFREMWRFNGPEPCYFHRVPKSTPCLDGDKIFFGADDGFFYALRQADGMESWKFKVGYSANGKSIFSSPAIYEDTVYFGSYDGNVYALNKDSGKLKWKYMDADYIGSSPALAPDLGMLFIGLEFGLFAKKGGIAALDLKNGKKIWTHIVQNYIHCSPAYCPERKFVAISCNDSFTYLFDAKNGKLRWKFQAGGPTKASLVFDLKRNLLIFGSFDKNLYALDISTGKIRGKFEVSEAINSTPKIQGDDVYFTSLDKNIYSINLETGKLNWRFLTGGRVFSSPEIIENRLVVGSNDGGVYELNMQSGQLESYFQTTERITNKIVYNPETKRYFVLTYANEIYCLTKNADDKTD